MTEVIGLLLLPLITAIIIPLIDYYFFQLVKKVIVISGIFNLYLAGEVLLRVNQAPLTYNLGSWGEKIGINLVIDPFSAVIIVVINFVALTVILYSVTYINQEEKKYYMLVLLLITGMLGLTATGDLFNMYVFIEIISITSCSLVAFRREATSFEASFKYLFMNSVSAILILLAIILIYQTSGTLNLAGLVITEIPTTFKGIILVLLLVGFSAKFAIVPFHGWLPGVYSAAPNPISALLAGIVTKIYLYALIRLLFILFSIPELIAYHLDVILIYGGVITLLVGHLLAFKQEKLKRLLAYSSIAQMGYIIIGLGLFSAAGLKASIYYMISHAVIKTALFLGAGLFMRQTGQDRIASYRGLGHKSPLVTGIFTISAINMVGLPPFNYFINKWLLIKAIAEQQMIIPVIFILIGTLLSASYYFRVIILLYSQEAESNKQEVKSITWQLKTPLFLLTASYILLFIAPNLPLVTEIMEQIPKFLLKPLNYYQILMGG
ncbi:MAG: complex I subunit 5 family protein [Bacillota bacterium]